VRSCSTLVSNQKASVKDRCGESADAGNLHRVVVLEVDALAASLPPRRGLSRSCRRVRGNESGCEKPSVLRPFFILTSSKSKCAAGPGREGRHAPPPGIEGPRGAFADRRPALFPHRRPAPASRVSRLLLRREQQGDGAGMPAVCRARDPVRQRVSKRAEAVESAS